MSAWFKKLFQKEASKPDASFLQPIQPASAARTFLSQDQARIAKEIEEMYGLYDQRLQSLALRIKTLSEDDLARELESLREAQDDLRTIVRRFQAALKGTEELERELDGWEGQTHDRSPIHADHPLVRSEIIRSELTLRDEETLRQGARPLAPEMEFLPPPSEPRPSNVSSAPAYEVRVHEVDPVRVPSEAHLLQAIREAIRETNRWHAVHPSQYSQDAVDQAKQLKYLHAILRRLDKQQGITRDRSLYWPEMK